MDFSSQELFPSLCSTFPVPEVVWKKSNFPGLDIAKESSMERLDIPKENLVIFDVCLMSDKKTAGSLHV